MASTILKGKISAADHAVKYDDEGIEYFLYTITIDKKKYTSKTPRGLYLSSDAPIVCEVENDVILAGYCPKENCSWGKNVRRLKKQITASDKYEFIEGVVIEKRKQVSSDNDFTKDAMYRNQGVGYTVVLKDRNFHASYLFGKPIKPDMHIAVVLEQNDAVLLQIKSTGKIIGLQRPYYILLTLMLIAFNATMFYLFKTNQTHLINFKMTLIVINVFLVLFTLLSIATYVQGNKVKKFFKEQCGN
jgi:hypothetical protein